MTDIDALLETVVRKESNPPAPAGLEQRLLARLQQAAQHASVPQFAAASRMSGSRGTFGTGWAIGIHALAALAIAWLAATHRGITAPRTTQLTSLLSPPPSPVPPSPYKHAMGGGGGQHSPTPVTSGHLPKIAAQQFLPPKAPPTLVPKLATEPAVVVQKNLQLADNHLPDLGVPNSNLKGFSLGNGNGSGTGIGSGEGNGIGPGSGGNMGGGIRHIGGAVRAPVLLSSVDAEYSEEARKAKFDGNVVVALIVDEHGLPTDVRVIRDVGMGLGNKAMEAVRQYRFRPATENGKPVKVDMTIEVQFQIF